VVVVMMEGPDKWRPHVRKAVWEEKSVFLLFSTESQFLPDVFDGPPEYDTSITRAGQRSKVKIWPLGIVSHTVWSPGAVQK
jgi:hypothetical protein